MIAEEGDGWWLSTAEILNASAVTCWLCRLTARLARSRGPGEGPFTQPIAGRSARAAATGLHDPNASFEAARLKRRIGWFPHLRHGAKNQEFRHSEVSGDRLILAVNRS
jgi:hypothetical protein